MTVFCVSIFLIFCWCKTQCKWNTSINLWARVFILSNQICHVASEEITKFVRNLFESNNKWNINRILAAIILPSYRSFVRIHNKPDKRFLLFWKHGMWTICVDYVDNLQKTYCHMIMSECTDHILTNSLCLFFGAFQGTMWNDEAKHT